MKDIKVYLLQTKNDSRNDEILFENRTIEKNYFMNSKKAELQVHDRKI